MKKNLQELALILGGSVLGDPAVEITGATNIAEATEQHITFAVAQHLAKAEGSKAGAVIVPENVTQFSKPAICVDNPRAAFAKLLKLFYTSPAVERTIHPSAIVGQNVLIGNNVAIMPNAVISSNCAIGDNTIIYPNTYLAEGVKIGSDCLIYPNVTIREYSVVGNNVIIHSGAVLGSDGFGFVTIEGRHHKVPQVGNIIIEDDVEIGANTAIDRATTGSTIIKRGTKVDNLVHLAHNVTIGEDCLIVAQTGIAGSVVVGNNVTFAGQSGSAGHLKIGDNCVFAARAAAISDVPANSFYAGFPARPHKEWLRVEAALYKMPELIKKIRELENRIEELED